MKAGARNIDKYATARERKIARSLVRNILQCGLRVSVYDGEETTVDKADSVSDVMDALATTCSDVVSGWDRNNQVCWFLLIWGNDDDLISDQNIGDVAEAIANSANN